jgi:hypothetical protein
MAAGYLKASDAFETLIRPSGTFSLGEKDQTSSTFRVQSAYHTSRCRVQGATGPPAFAFGPVVFDAATA